MRNRRLLGVRQREGEWPGVSAESVAVLEGRIARTAASRELSLVEQPTYKRRWYRPVE